MGKKAKTIDDVLSAVAKHFQIKAEDLDYSSDVHGFAKPRKIAIYLAHQLEDPSITSVSVASAMHASKQTVSGHFNSLDKIIKKELGTRSEDEIDLLADLHTIANDAHIPLQ